MGASLFLSFTSYDLFTAPKWVGLDNYKAMLTDDEKYWGSLKVTFYYVLAGVPLRLAFALFIAVILNRAEKGVGIYRTLFFISRPLSAAAWRSRLCGEMYLAMTVLSMRFYSSSVLTRRFFGIRTRQAHCGP